MGIKQCKLPKKYAIKDKVKTEEYKNVAKRMKISLVKKAPQPKSAVKQTSKEGRKINMKILKNSYPNTFEEACDHLGIVTISEFAFTKQENTQCSPNSKIVSESQSLKPKILNDSKLAQIGRASCRERVSSPV